jgi:hypothetical protein
MHIRELAQKPFRCANSLVRLFYLFFALGVGGCLFDTPSDALQQKNNSAAYETRMRLLRKLSI